MKRTAAWLILLGLLACPAAHAAPVFTRVYDPFLTRVGGGIPSNMATADFDGDGHDDLAVINSLGSSGILTILLSRGDSLAVLGDFATGTTRAVAVATGDLNHDGVPDVVTCSRTAIGQGWVSVMLGAGNGDLGGALVLPASSPAAVGIADLTGDGNNDVVYIDGYSGTLVVLPGNGNGTFSEGRYLQLASDVYDLECGDINGDGQIDVVVLDASGSEVTVITAGTGGAFMTRSLTVSHATGMCLGDLDGDGRLDLAVTSPSLNRVSTYLNDGSPFTFSAESSVNSPQEVAAGDIDGDGRSDLVVTTGGSQPGPVMSLMSLGNGMLSAPKPTAPGAGPYPLAVGRFGTSPRASAVVGYAGEAALLRGNPDGSLGNTAGYSSIPAGSQLQSIVAADLDQDGHLDLAITGGYPQRAQTFHGVGNGTFVADSTYALDPSMSPWDLGVADFDNDGYPDVAVGDYSVPGKTVILFGGRNGLTNGRLELPGTSIGPLAIADVDKNGLPDIVSPTNPPTVLLNDGSRAFHSVVIADAGPGPALCLGDLTGDGNCDVAILSGGISGGIVQVSPGNGDGTFGPTVSFDSGRSNARHLSMCDVDHDGDLDLLVSADGGVSILINDGTGHFTARPVADSHSPLGGVIGVDFDRDGGVDILVSEPAGNQFHLLHGRSNDLVYVDDPYPSGGGAPGNVAVGDFNGDGATDVAVCNPGSDNVSVFLNQTGPVTEALFSSRVAEYRDHGIAVQWYAPKFVGSPGQVEWSTDQGTTWQRGNVIWSNGRDVFTYFLTPVVPGMQYVLRLAVGGIRSEVVSVRVPTISSTIGARWLSDGISVNVDDAPDHPIAVGLYDVQGRRLAHGSIAPHTRETTLRARGVSGVYFLVAQGQAFLVRKRIVLAW